MIRILSGFFLLLFGSVGYASDAFNVYASRDTAKLYSYAGEFLKAARLFEQCAKASKGTPLNYLQNLHDASENYYMLDDYAHVKSLCEEYDKVFKSIRSGLRSESDSIFDQRRNKMWGTYYYGQTTSDTSDVSFHSAEKHYMDAINDFGDEDFDRALYQDIAQLYYKWKRYDDALHYLDLIPQSRSVSASAEVLSNKAMCLARMCDFGQALSLIEAAMQMQKEVEQYESLRRKGKILMMQHDADGTGGIDEARMCYEKYVRYQTSTMTKRLEGMTELQREQYWLKLHDFLTDCCRLGGDAPELLYNLALFCKGYLLEYSHNGENVQQIKWQQVQHALQDDEAAVEFLQYNACNDEPRFGALVLKAGMKQPIFMDIASADSIPTGISSYGDKKTGEVIWNGSIRGALKDVKKIYFAADGILHKCPIEYQHPDSTTCVRLSSTKVLVKKRQSINTSRILLCGGIDYSSSTQSDFVGNDEVSYQALKRLSPAIFYLPGTKRELDSISQSRKSISDLTLEGKDASDMNFCAAAGNFPCLHVATHGYYVSSTHKGTDLKPLTNDESMSCSGLVFAGAAYALRDTIRTEGQPDGLLSAKELSRLNLSEADLVVLSACQSAQGEVTSEGIYGLQRALKLAGAKSIIASLWDVDDNATAFLMSRFYENLAKCSSAHEAFLQARRQLKESKAYRFSASSLSSRESALFDNPQYTDAFIMIDVIC